MLVTSKADLIVIFEVDVKDLFRAKDFFTNAARVHDFIDVHVFKHFGVGYYWLWLLGTLVSLEVNGHLSDHIHLDVRYLDTLNLKEIWSLDI